MELNDYINRSRKLVSNKSMGKVKIAFLSNFTVMGLADVMKVLCYNENSHAECYNAPYNQYSQEILNKNSGLYDLEPDIIFIILDIEHLFGDFYYFPYRLSVGERKALIQEKFDEISDLLDVLSKNTKSKIIVNNLLIPVYSSFGILENKQGFGIRECIHFFNGMLASKSGNHAQLFIFDYNSFCAKIGYEKLIDNKLNYIADMRISPSALVKLGEEYMSYVLPLISSIRKCIVLDADNTLWGGIIGEDGLANLKLGPEKEGKAFLDFQKRLLAISERGILLAINSSNNYDDVMEVLEKHRFMLLKKENFACMKINWQDKVTNMKEIAKELNIGLESLVFIDDNKPNREMVKKLLPEIFVVDLPEDTSSYASTFENLNIFSTFAITDEDKKRAKNYIIEKKRAELRSSVSDVKSFIKQLNVKVNISPADTLNTSRIAQLTQKTNQFNLTTKRYTEEDIKKFASSDDCLVKCIQVEDKFGDYGITGVVIVKKRGRRYWDIDSYLLSCRVLGRDVEFRFMQGIVEEARKSGVEEISCRYFPTPKNKPAKNFLLESGFKLDRKETDGFLYRLSIKKK